MLEREIWSETVGEAPYRVTVYERLSKGRVLYLRWYDRQKENWRHESLKRTLPAGRGKIVTEAKEAAKADAWRKHRELVAQAPEEARPAARPLTIAEGLERVIHAETGKYPTDTPHRREVIRQMQFAMLVWGAGASWESIKKAEIRALWRRRIRTLAKKGVRGYRGAEITVIRVLTVAEWLRGEELISPGACVGWKNWKAELLKDWLELTNAHREPEPSRPRHTLAEYRRILAAAPQVDPRFHLMTALAAENRLGQARRARRTDLDLEAGTFRIPGRGKKKGAVVKLTAGQLAAAREALTNGYLRDLEEHWQLDGTDYPLFPSGQLRGSRGGRRSTVDPKASKHASLSTPERGYAVMERHGSAPPVGPTAIRKWFLKAQEIAGVARVDGRGAYGLRRAAVDGAKALGISREAMREHGGWTDNRMPDEVYADQEAEWARDEAREARAKLRGEEA